MEVLSQFNIKVQPLKLSDLQQVLQLIMDSFEAASVIVQKNIQTKQDMRRNTQILIPKLIRAEQQINKNRNTNIHYSVKYSINGKIIGTILTCDLIKFLKITDQIQPDYYFQLLKNHGQKMQIGKDVYFGKSAIDKNYMSKGIAKYMYFQRVQYFNKNGYNFLYALAGSQKVAAICSFLGGKRGKAIEGKLDNNQTYQFPLFILTLEVSNKIIEKSIKKKLTPTSSL